MKNYFTIIAIILLIVGVATLAFGFLYNVIFAGIPYQDAPPELLQRYDLNTRISGFVYCTGAVISLAGLLLLAVRLVLRMAGK